MIVVNNLVVERGEKAVLNMDKLILNTGDINLIIGENGSGKSTFFLAMLNLIRLKSGTISFQNISSKDDKVKPYVSHFVNRNNLIPYLKPLEYFELLCCFYDVSKRQYEADLLLLQEFLKEEILEEGKLIKNLSEGNIQKVGIAGSLLCNSKYVLLDEPFAHLDSDSANLLTEIINRWNKERNVTFVISSHQKIYYDQLNAKIMTIKSGKIIETIE